MAVLFRINAQSPAIEQALADRQVPYLVRSGERFYERAEVRQALLTLRTEARVAPMQEKCEAALWPSSRMSRTAAKVPSCVEPPAP